MPFNFGDESLTSGQPVAIQCMITAGDLPLVIRWAFHGQELSTQMGISIIKAGPRLSILTIDSIAAGHSGDYTCTASNNAATVNYTATLAVNGLLPGFTELWLASLLFSLLGHTNPNAFYVISVVTVFIFILFRFVFGLLINDGCFLRSKSTTLISYDV